MENVEKREVFALGRSPFKIYESIKWTECSKWDPVKINGKEHVLPDGFCHILSIYSNETFISQISYFTHNNDDPERLGSLRVSYTKALLKHFIKPMSELLEKLDTHVALQA